MKIKLMGWKNLRRPLDPRFSLRTRILPGMLGLIIAIIFGTGLGMGQQASTTLAPIFNANAKYVQGVGPGYWPTAGVGLTLNLAAGSAYCGNPPALVTYTAGTLTMVNAATSLVYLDPANTCVPSVSQAANFSVGQIPIAKVVTAGNVITTITDMRGAGFAPLPCAMSAAGAVGCSALGANQNISLAPSGAGQMNFGTTSGFLTTPQSYFGIFNGAQMGCLNISFTTCSQIVLQSNATSGYLNGLYGASFANNASGTISANVAVEGDAYSEGAGSVSVDYGVNGYAEQDGSGTVATMAALHALHNDKTAGTVNQNFGLLVEAQTAGSTNYAIYTQGTAPSVFGGNVTVPSLNNTPFVTSTTAGADWGAKFNTVDTALIGTPTEIWVDQTAGTSAPAANIVVSANHILRFVPGGNWSLGTKQILLNHNSGIVSDYGYRGQGNNTNNNAVTLNYTGTSFAIGPQINTAATNNAFVKGITILGVAGSCNQGINMQNAFSWLIEDVVVKHCKTGPNAAGIMVYGTASTAYFNQINRYYSEDNAYALIFDADIAADCPCRAMVTNLVTNASTLGDVLITANAGDQHFRNFEFNGLAANKTSISAASSGNVFMDGGGDTSLGGTTLINNTGADNIFGAVSVGSGYTVPYTGAGARPTVWGNGMPMKFSGSLADLSGHNIAIASGSGNPIFFDAGPVQFNTPTDTYLQLLRNGTKEANWEVFGGNTFFDSTGLLSFRRASDSATMMTINNSTGNVGMGTTNPLWPLHVGAGQDVANFTPTIYASNNGATAVVVRDSTNHAEAALFSSGGLIGIGSRTAHDVYFQANSNNVGRIANGTGRWAIGGVAAPSQKLDVQGGSIDSAVNTVTFSATPTFDASLGNTQTITLTGSVTSSTLSNCTAGEWLVFDIIQNATGNFTFVWPTNVLNAGTIGATASKHNIQTFYCDGSNARATGAMLTNQN